MTSEPENREASTGQTAAEGTVVLPNKAGLHARSAAALIKGAARFTARVVIQRGHSTASCRSLMELLRLSARQGDVLRVRAEGPDAEAALQAVCALIESGFGED